MTRAIFHGWSADRIASCCGGRVYGRGDLQPTGLSNDGRVVQAGEMFIALEDRRDGHDFIAQARKRGARLFLVAADRRPALVEGEAAVAVADTYDALVDLGRRLWREHAAIRPDRVTIGITGSNGKTTTKDLVGNLLKAAYPDCVLATRGNLNNHIGLPLMLTELSAEHQYVALEMGASRKGDIALLTEIAPVDRAIVTCISPAHIEGFGDLDGLVAEKGRIFAGRLPPSIVVLPEAWRDRGLLPSTFTGQVRTFGPETEASVRTTDFVPGQCDRARLVLDETVGAESVDLALTLGLSGEHNVQNLAAAVAAIWDLLPSADRASLTARVATDATPAKGRLDWVRGASGCWVLDDTYNANPGSLQAALQVFQRRPGRRWAILGDMLELGERAPEEHVNAGMLAGRAGCARVWAVGTFAEHVLEGARLEGVRDRSAFEDARGCADAASRRASAEDVILVKGSRGVALEIVVSALTSTDRPRPANEEVY